MFPLWVPLDLHTGQYVSTVGPFYTYKQANMNTPAALWVLLITKLVYTPVFLHCDSFYSYKLANETRGGSPVWRPSGPSLLPVFKGYGHPSVCQKSGNYSHFYRRGVLETGSVKCWPSSPFHKKIHVAYYFFDYILIVAFFIVPHLRYFAFTLVELYQPCSRRTLEPKSLF